MYCIRFIARHFLLWKLTGAKFNFENMFQQERNLNGQGQLWFFVCKTLFARNRLVFMHENYTPDWINIVRRGVYYM